MLNLDPECQKSITHLYTMQIFILLRPCIICQNIVTISMTSGSLWSYYRDEVNDHANENNDPGRYRINNKKTTTSKSFEYKTKITGSTLDY